MVIIPIKYVINFTILFGESLPPGVLDGAMSACRDCDCFIMVGSSLAVSPANFMPSIAKNYGAYIIFINKENTLMDTLANIFLKGSASQIFTELMKNIKE